MCSPRIFYAVKQNLGKKGAARFRKWKKGAGNFRKREKLT